MPGRRAKATLAPATVAMITVAEATHAVRSARRQPRTRALQRAATGTDAAVMCGAETSAPAEVCAGEIDGSDASSSENIAVLVNIRPRGRPVRVRRAVLDEPTVHQTRVGLPADLMPRVERRELPLQPRQPIERHAREVVMLEVVVG